MAGVRASRIGRGIKPLLWGALVVTSGACQRGGGRREAVDLLSRLFEEENVEELQAQALRVDYAEFDDIESLEQLEREGLGALRVLWKPSPALLASFEVPTEDSSDSQQHRFDAISLDTTEPQSPRLVLWRGNTPPRYLDLPSGAVHRIDCERGTVEAGGSVVVGRLGDVVVCLYCPRHGCSMLRRRKEGGFMLIEEGCVSAFALVDNSLGRQTSRDAWQRLLKQAGFTR